MAGLERLAHERSVDLGMASGGSVSGPGLRLASDGSAATVVGRRRRFRERYWGGAVMLLADVAAMQLALQLGIQTRLALTWMWPVELGWSTVSGMHVAVVAVPVILWMMGLTPGYGVGPVERIRRRFYVTLFVFSCFFAWDYFLQGNSWSRGVLIATLVIAAILLPVMEAAVRHILIRLGAWGVPVLLIVNERSRPELLEKISGNPTVGLVPVGLMVEDGAAVPVGFDALPVVGTTATADELRWKVRSAILDLPDRTPERLASLISRLPFEKVFMVPALHGLQSLCITTRDLGGLLALQVDNNLRQRHNLIMKTVLDYTLGIIAFLFSLPLMLLCVLAIRCVESGSPFYGQMREGLNGKPFRMWKLRTMYRDADARLEQHLQQSPAARAEWNRYMKLRDDPRVLPIVGDLLRKTSLDELPQLWNVLRGEMSLVGPRPFPDYHLRRFDATFREFRCQVKPGLTGLWQVSARSDGDLTVQQDLDTYFIRNWSVWLDLYLLFRTVTAVSSRRGAR